MNTQTISEMAPLKSLEREHPIIDSHFQKFCASHGIFSVEDFLIHDVDLLAEQHAASEKLKEGIRLVLSIIDVWHHCWMNGVELLEDAQQKKQFISIGCERIDTLLCGGLRKGHVTELVGPSSSGKTQICLHAASSVAKKYLGGVVFIDTGNAFSPKRVAQIVSQNFICAKEEPNKILQQVMNGIICHAVYDIFTLFDVLLQLESNVTSQTGCQVQLLVVDSISSLITPILGGCVSHGHALMISTGFLLKKIAHEHNLSVLVTNHMVSGEGGIPKPALGENWKSVSHVRLLVSRDHGNDICNMSILSHPSMASGVGVKFAIS